MILSITSLKVKRFYQLFKIWPYSFQNMLQLQRNSKCVAFKTIGFTNPSYTMTLWENEKDLKDYVTSGSHLSAMQEAVKWAEEIKSVRVESNSLITWKEAKKIIASQGKLHGKA